MSFVHLHVHSCYSLLDGLRRPEQLVQRAKECGQNALALSDHGVLYGAVEHYQTCQSQGVKPIIGCEVYVTPNLLNKEKAKLNELPYDNSHLVLLAKSNQGYENLCRIVSISMLKGFYYKPRVDNKLLEEYGEGIIALSACLAGEIPRLILLGKYGEAKVLANYYNSIFDGFYLEIQANHIPAQTVVNAELIRMSQETGIPLVVTCDAHYATKNDGIFHQNFTIIGGADTERWAETYSDTWLKSEAEIREFNFPEEALINTQVIADSCNISMEMGNFHLPKINIPSGYTLDNYLCQLCSDGLFQIAMEKDINVEEYANRLAYELSVIEQKGLAGYFLIVQDLVNWAKSQDILVGPGRGSAAGSLISYTLGITAIDPIEHGLLFQRFLNPERKSLPDIDLDIMDIARGDIINYLSKKYGQDNVCQIITFGTLQSKMALKDAGRILGIKFEVVNNITSKILSIDGRPYSIQQSIDLIPDVAQASQEYPELFELAMHLEGIPRHSGIHAAGVVITPDELVKYIPLARGKNEEAIAQFEKNTLEDLGLLKLDILALKTLTTMYYALQSIRELHGVKINLNKIPLDDPATLRLIASGNTIGVFQLESEGMQRIFKELNNVTFKALVAGISLYRPGPLSLIPTYISGYNGLRHVDYLVPQLEPILKDTYGVILYQEQTMKIATDLAGYTPGQSDSLRKAIGKKLPEVMKQEMHKLVYGSSEEGIPGMIANGISEDNAIKIAELIERFAGYGFNLSHATGYAVLAFQTAYLKAHYPLEFMCAQLSVAGNKDKVTKYAQEAIRMGIKILPPSINKSGVNFLIENGNIRFALSSINGVGEKIAQRIIENAPYENIEYLLDALPKRTLNKKVLRALALSGALDELDPYNCRMQLYQRLLTLREDKEDISDKVKEFNTRSKLQYEYDLTGLYISDHPLRRIAKPVAWDIIPEKQSIINHILISDIKVTTTKKGLDMCIVNAETLEGPKSFYIFTKAYNQYKDEIVEGGIAKVTFTKEHLGLVIHNIKLPKKYN